jgi:type IV secretory pathway VirB4 component
MIINKTTTRKFALYIDEFHSVRHIDGVLWMMNKFVRICRSHNGAECLVDQGLGVVSGDADRKYKEIFELMQYGFYFNSSENDVSRLEEMLGSSGRPLSEIERRFITRAKFGECLMVMST